MNGNAAPERSPSASPPTQVQTQSPAPTPTQPLEWRFSQVFGERGAGEEVQDGTRSIPLTLLV
jgi:serine/threonine-protein phosphatase 2A regulatory subunit B